MRPTPKPSEPASPRPHTVTHLRLGVRRLGGLGVVAMGGLAVAAVLTVAMGFTITRTSRAHLLQARAELIESEVDTLPIGPGAPANGPAFDAFAAAAAGELHGGEIENLKIWSRDGEILYARDGSIIGDRYALTPPAVRAFDGETATLVSDLEDPAHARQRGKGELIEIYVPVTSATGEVTMVVEVELSLESLNKALGAISRNVWTSIIFGVTVLAVFLSIVGIAVLRASDRRRTQAEQLLAQSFHSQDEERRRIVGYLHDDVGQPLYRLLYGIEGSRAKLPRDSPVSAELEHMGNLVRGIDGILRSELATLHEGIAADAGLTVALQDLAETTRSETDLHVTLQTIEEPTSLSDVQRTALFRAAQEAVVNVRKHAEAMHVTIALEENGGRVLVAVDDDGTGRINRKGLGLTTNAERLDALGGGLEIATSPKRGSRIVAWLPADSRQT